MDFGIIDTTPSHGFKVACIHSTTTQTQHSRFVTLCVSYVGNHAALLLCGPHATHRSTSLTSLETRFDFGFRILVFGQSAPELATTTHFTSSAQAHVNQKSFGMTTPNDIGVRCNGLVLRVPFARRANDDRARRAASNCDPEQKCWLTNHVAAANRSPQ
jgi:hypothetical protein